MVAINALANILPINGITTGAVSDSYPNLFAPAGITFAIWGVIYALLLAFTLYAAGLFRNSASNIGAGALTNVCLLFSLSSVANALWIICWHYGMILYSMGLMALILVCLIGINLIINRERLSGRDTFFIRLPFSVYFGWITVATIANATALLVDAGWTRFGLSEPVWTAIMLCAGLVIGTATILCLRDAPYGLVLIWAYAGILIKHLSPAGFNKAFMLVIVVVCACLALFALAVISTLFRKRRT
jgi:hypothetical protein